MGDWLSGISDILGPKLSSSGSDSITDSVAGAALASNPITAGLSAGMDLLGGMTGGSDQSKSSAQSGGTLTSAGGAWTTNFGSSGSSNNGILVLIVIVALLLILGKKR